MLRTGPMPERPAPRSADSKSGDRERERLLAELRALREKRLELARVVSHDLRSPLTVVQGHTQLLERLLGVPGKEDLARRSLQAVIESVARINLMIQDLVDAERLDAGVLGVETAPVDVAEFLATFLDGARGSLDVPRLSVHADDRLPPVLADSARLTQILTKLLSNALKYSQQPVSLTVRGTEDRVRFAVADTGPGIDPFDLPRVTERFYRAKFTPRQTDGLGLGLHLTKKLVELQGGRFLVESERGRGTTCSFTLPVAGRPQDGKPPALPPR